MIRAGDLNCRVQLQEATETQDGYGAVVKGWATTATPWGEVKDLSGREFFAAQQENAEVTTRIRMRYRAGVMPKMRAIANGRTFDILAVLDPEGRKRELHLMCKEVVEEAV
jgi:SPP1 family predicted phage head-tail adaptor